MGPQLGVKIYYNTIQVYEFKSLLLVHCKRQNFDIAYEAFLGHGILSLFK